MLGLDDVSATIGLLAVFGVLFPALAHVLIGFAIAQVMGERNANQAYKKRSGQQPNDQG